jgi:hypothetical protein
VSRLNVEQGEKPVDRKVLAEAIVNISRAFLALRSTGLNRKAIVLLVSHSAKVRQMDVEAVLDSLENLRREYTNL